MWEGGLDECCGGGSCESYGAGTQLECGGLEQRPLS